MPPRRDARATVYRGSRVGKRLRAKSTSATSALRLSIHGVRSASRAADATSSSTIAASFTTSRPLFVILSWPPKPRASRPSSMHDVRSSSNSSWLPATEERYLAHGSQSFGGVQLAARPLTIARMTACVDFRLGGPGHNRDTRAQGSGTATRSFGAIAVGAFEIRPVSGVPLC